MKGCGKEMIANPEIDNDLYALMMASELRAYCGKDGNYCKDCSPCIDNAKLGGKDGKR